MAARETHLPASRDQLGDVVERLPLGVILVSRPGPQVGYANVAAQRMLHPAKLRRGALLPDPWAGLSLPGYADRLFELGFASEEEVNVADDRSYVVKGLAPRRSPFAVLLLEDTSGRERRRRAEREFVANAAHELLTPLTGLAGAAHVLEAGAKEVPEDRDRFISHIADECARLTHIARSLLVLARAQSGEEPPRLEVMPLRPLLEDVVALVGGARTDSFVIECPPDATVFADPDLLTQAITNLVSNAVAHGSGETISVSVAALSGRRVAIQVSDGSAGARAAREVAGRRFRTGAGRDGRGFGLGLSIAAQSVEVMGGRLEVAGDESAGTVARVELLSGQLS
jgi:signal transduction histidine kinase